MTAGSGDAKTPSRGVAAGPRGDGGASPTGDAGGSSTRIPCAVLGATGMVGQRFAERLAGHPLFEPVALVASDRSAGRPYGDATRWALDRPMPAALARTKVSLLEELPASVRLVFSALPAGIAGPVERDLAAAGKRVFTNARDHRMDDDVPLLIPEVNPDDIALASTQPGDGFIVANGNCSGIVLALALAPLHRAFGIEAVHVTTLQGLSGAGHPGVPALDIIDNVLPFIPGEEEKMAAEPHKTLHGGFPVHATCTRVPVREGHLESVHVTLSGSATPEAVREAFTSFRGPADVAGLPSAPRRPIHFLDAPDRPQPRLDRDREAGMAVSVGRLRVTGPEVRFVALGHNTVRGAAGQSILNAEYAHARGLLD